MLFQTMHCRVASAFTLCFHDCGYDCGFESSCSSSYGGEILIFFFQPNTIFCGVGTPLNGALIYRSLKCMKLLIKASIFLDSFCLLPLCWLFFCLLKPSGPFFPRFSKLYCAILLTGNSCELAIAAKECLA